MRFVQFSDVTARLRNKRVAVVGSAPSVLDNAPGFIDGHDAVVRVNNFKLGEKQGHRCDVHYSFYGTSVRATADDLKRAGVTLCMCKCPDAKPLECDWHERANKLAGIDFRYIYRNRAQWWFCDTWIPSVSTFLHKFELLHKHIPTTGFSAILDVLACGPASVYLTGFDGFTSGMHNVNERWKPGDTADPIGHRPEMELAWIAENRERYPLSMDAKLTALLRARLTAA